jgi:hypothetical protein
MMLRNIIREQFEIVPKIKLELVLSKTPDTVEVSFDGLYVTSITYNENSVSLSIEMVDYSKEPFPQHRFVPQYFPGIF